MAIRFNKLTRQAIRVLTPGQKLFEHGIVVSRLASGDLRYSINVMVDGIRIHRVIGTESAGVTREQAERAIESLRTQARENRLNLPQGRKTALKFSDAAEDYLSHLRIEDGKQLPRKTQHLDTYLKDHFGTMRVDAIQDGDVSAYISKRKASGARPGTINRELATFSHLMRSATRWGWLPSSRLPRIPRLTEGRGRTVVLTPKQSIALLEAAEADQDPDLWLFILICLQTSMRHGEAKQLRWEHFDPHRRRFYIPRAKAGEREQPLPAELTELLSATMKQRGASSGYVFEGGPGTRTGYRNSFRKAFRRAVVRAGLNPDEITPHVMRHTAITRLVKAGIDLPTVQKVSAHKTLTMVLRYSHVDGLHVDNAVECLSLR